MRRTQLYLDDSLWETLHANAKAQCTTVSDLVRQAVREKYSVDYAARDEGDAGHCWLVERS